MPVDDFNVHPETPVTVEVKLHERGSLHGVLGSSLPKDAVASPCKSENGKCWEWTSEQQKMIIQDEPSATGSNQCKTVVWLSQDIQTSPEFSWDLSDDFKWYGGGSVANQKWPIATDSLSEQPQITGGGTDAEDTNDIHNRLWFSTLGVAIKVEDNVPLFVTIEGGQKLTFKAENKPPYRYNEFTPPTLSYAVCYGRNLTELYITVMSLFLELPKATPPDNFFSAPVWNTWPKFPTVTNSTLLKDYADKIENSVATVGSLFLVGHGWTSCIGELQMDSLVIPHPMNFINYLKAKGMHVGLWVHPHMSADCDQYQEGSVRSYFVATDKGKPTTGLWLGHLVATVDFTNPESVEWYTKGLRDLQTRFGIESFYFDRGQSSFLPKGSKLMNGPRGLQPDFYSTKYVELAAAISNMSVVNVGRNTQQLPLFVRMPAKKGNTWDQDSIQSVIPSILQMGISGFPFVLPEVIGGSATPGSKPERNLYIRWLELSALLPTMHFSVGPWEYDDEVVKIANDMLSLRETKLETDIKRAAKAALVDGSPMIRPVWWIAPYDPQALAVSDQFLVGNSLMVAPVVEDKEVRDIYIPPGHWRSSLNNGQVIKGPTILKNCPVKLNQLAYFEADYA